MPESEHNVQDVIQGYRRRRERLVPLLLGIVAGLLVVIGVVLVVMWLSGGTPPSLPFFGHTATPTSTLTLTPLPPTATATITLTLPPTETPTPVGPQTYRVQEGDTLTSIAAQFQVDILLLMSVNNITDPNAIFSGQELTIPAPGTERSTATPLPETLASGTRIRYMVEPGDSLESIAARFNSTAEAIATASGIRVTDTIGPGQILTVPVGIVTPTRTRTAAPSTATSVPSTPTNTRIP
jgi:LysM repeat protein